jgi:GAF domain-containing protein
MSFSGTFLRTKVARRILALFMLTAVFPIAALTLISYRQVTEQLSDQSRERLRQTSKIAGMGILERLDVLRSDLQLVSATLQTQNATSAFPDELASSLGRHFRAIVLQSPDGALVLISGEIGAQPAPSEEETEHLAEGRPILRVDLEPDPPAVLMGRRIDAQSAERGTVWGHIDPGFLWDAGTEGTLQAGTDMCVLVDRREPLRCTRPLPPRALEDLSPVLTSSDAARFEWRDADDQYLAGFWSMFLGFEYAAAPWTIVMSESKASILTPLADFKRTFLLVTLLTVCFVFFFSNIEIRRHTKPLVELKLGTQRLAAGTFDQPVSVSSGDEFEELADAFNHMSHNLALQFATLTAISDIDHAVLSVFDKKRVVDTVLRRAREAVGCESVSMCLFRPLKSPNGVELWSSRWVEGAGVVAEGAIAPAELAELQSHPRSLVLDRTGADRTYLDFAGNLGHEPHRFVVLPMRTDEELSGVLVLAYGARDGVPATGDPSLDRGLSDDISQGRQLADQVAVAMSNAKLVEDLDELSWGAITALARAVDAKSAWTAGHSERVTDLALALGRELRLSEDELENLNRGGLLHDIGKIGVPGAILDKLGALTETEFLKMREHPEIGARILEPVAAFGPSLGIVLHHHERWDGRGYPHGLAGEDIPFLARVLAISDVYDALTSDRPYRDGFTSARTLAILRDDAGTHFDPDLVPVFLALMEVRGETADATRMGKPAIPERATA